MYGLWICLGVVGTLLAYELGYEVAVRHYMSESEEWLNMLKEIG